MADHLIATPEALKTITIQISSDGKMRILIGGFRKHVCEQVSREYYEKTVYICKRYCPEVIVEA